MDIQSSPSYESQFQSQKERESALAIILKGYENFRLDIQGKIMSGNFRSYLEWGQFEETSQCSMPKQIEMLRHQNKNSRRLARKVRLRFSMEVERRRFSFLTQIT